MATKGVDAESIVDPTPSQTTQEHIAPNTGEAPLESLSDYSTYALISSPDDSEDDFDVRSLDWDYSTYEDDRRLLAPSEADSESSIAAPLEVTLHEDAAIATGWEVETPNAEQSGVSKRVVASDLKDESTESRMDGDADGNDGEGTIPGSLNEGCMAADMNLDDPFVALGSFVVHVLKDGCDAVKKVAGWIGEAGWMSCFGCMGSDYGVQ